MARLLTEGFELGSTSIYANQTGTTTLGSISTNYVKSGTYDLKINPVNSGGGMSFQYKAFTSGIRYHRFNLLLHSVTTAGGLVYASYTSGGDFWAVMLNTDKSLALYYASTQAAFNTQIGSNSSPLTLDKWYRVEISENYTTNVVTLQINGSIVASGAAAGTGGNIIDIGMQTTDGSTSNYTCEIYCDDVAINDDSGSDQNSWCGEGSIIRLTPGAAGDSNTFATQTGGTAGSANNFTRVNEIVPNGATSYNGSNTLAEEDLYTCSSSGISAINPISLVAVGAFYRGSVSSATASFKIEVKKAALGTKSQSAAITPSSTTFKVNANSAPYNYPLVLYKDPDGAPWTQATIDAMQIGTVITTGNTNRVDVSTLWAMVEYVPLASLNISIDPTHNYITGVRLI